MPYLLPEIATIVKGRLLDRDPQLNSLAVTHLLTDSRRLSAPGGVLFFAIKTQAGDGHRYIPSLVEKGVKFFVVENEAVATGDAAFIVVRDSVAALQALASHHRQQFSFPVVGITGSNGKTIVKEWLFQLLSIDRNVVRSPKSYNSQVGVPLSVWQMMPEHEFALIEAGISQPGEMQKLEPVVRPAIGIFTHLGEAHQAQFSSMDQKVREKLKLFNHAGILIYCSDQETVHQAVKNYLPDIKRLTWGSDKSSTLGILNIKIENTDSRIIGDFRGQKVEITIPFADKAAQENACHCWLLMLHLGYDNQTIAARMRFLQPVEMRMQLKHGINRCLLLNDYYNSDLVSLALALDFLNQQEQKRRKTLILSDILQSGRAGSELYTEVATLLKEKGISRLFAIGPEINRHQDLFELKAEFFTTTQSFISRFNSFSFHDEAVLLKGARPFHFEDISRLLEQKQHRTRLEIDLNAMVHNLNVYRSLLKPNTRIMAMVKAFSYGSGTYEIANLLQFHQVDYLAVAYADEGVELRQAGIHLPIMVMNPEPSGFDAMLQHLLEPEIFSVEQLQQFAVAAASHLSEEPNPLYFVHLKINTGMHRLGVEPENIEALAEVIIAHPQVRVASVFTHLAASDEPENDAFTEQQIQNFKEICSQLRKRLDYDFLRHALNTSGIVRFPQYQMEMVRPGIGLYGIDSTGILQPQLRNVSTLISTISQIREVKAGETIGYSRKGKLNRDSRIATIGIGYADGLNRLLGNGRGSVSIKGKTAPIVGNVCMDMAMIDVTGIEAEVGEEVVIFGAEHPVQEMAELLGTIPYEILTSVSQRVKRIYYSE
ncbi:MAG: bifunctional UDP-N-acetylmuramoyl-tripeptide:D-alanyl-D-alanine ligase/alanine racemase [Bacteroidia bacterium]